MIGIVGRCAKYVFVISYLGVLASGTDGRYSSKPGRRELEMMFIFLRDKYLMMSTPEHKAEPVMVKTEGHVMVKAEKQVKRCCL